MRIEDKLGETMRRATATEPLPRDVYEAFERRAHRSQQTRKVAGGLALAAIVTLGAVFVPKIAQQDRGIGLGSPAPSTPSIEPSPSASPMRYKTHRNVAQAWSFHAPEDWKAGEFEGEYEVNPPGFHGMTVGDDTFALAVMLRNEVWDTGEKCPSSNAVCETDRDRSLFGGRHYWRIQRATENGGTYTVYRVDWSGPNVFCAPDTPCTTATLQVTVLGSTTDLLSRYADAAELFLDSIAHL